MSTTNFPATASPAVQFVQAAHNKFIGLAERNLSQAMAMLNAMAGFSPTAIDINVDLDTPPDPAPFQRPIEPDFDPGEYQLVQPAPAGLPPEFSPGDVSFDALPEWTAQAPTVQYSARPDKPNISHPVAPQRPTLPSMPVEPDYDRPQPVTLQSLGLPALPNIQLPEFNARRSQLPVFNIDDRFSQFTPEQYVSDLLQRLKQRVSTWLTGEEALPAAIEHALFGRGRTRIEAERVAQEAQAYDDFAARGFSAPNGLLASRLDGIRQDAQNKIAEFNRDAMLKSFDEALANMRLAVQQGIQLEGVTINLHLEMQRMILQSLAHARDTAIALLNARIAHFNAEAQGVQIDAQIFEARLKAELSKLDILRAQVEIEKLKSEQNQQAVEVYKAQWEAVRTMVGLYSERVNAVKTQMEAAKLPIEIFAKEVDAFEAMWGAYAKEISGWQAEIEGEQAKVQLYKTSADAYASRVQGVVAVGGLKNDRERLRIAQHGQLLERYSAQLKQVDQQIELEKARLGSVAQRDRAKSDVFRALADIEQAASAAEDRQFNSKLAAARAKTDTELQEAQIKASQNAQLQALILEAMKAIAQIQAQLAASTMSAVNYGANVGASDSFSRSRAVSWSGEAGDYAGQV